MTDSFRQLIAAAHTPMTEDGAIDLSIVSRQAEHYVASGVTGVFVAGTTGESVSLTVDERLVLAERWTEVAADLPLKILVHVGANCLADARRLAAHAQSRGADAIAAMAPNYFKPTEAASLVDFCRTIAFAAPNLPFYYYDIPAMSGVQLSMLEFLPLAKEQIPSFAGLKYTNQDLVQLQESLEFDGGSLEILFGCDEALLAGLAFGVHGAVGSTYNFAAPLYLQIIENFRSGNFEEARRLQCKSVELVRVLCGYGFMAAAKSVMGMLGIDCGPVRKPLLSLTVAQKEALRDELERIGFFEYSQSPAAVRLGN